MVKWGGLPEPWRVGIRRRAASPGCLQAHAEIEAPALRTWFDTCPGRPARNGCRNPELRPHLLPVRCGPPQLADRGMDLLPQIVRGHVTLLAQLGCTLQRHRLRPQPV